MSSRQRILVVLFTFSDCSILTKSRLLKATNNIYEAHVQTIVHSFICFYLNNCRTEDFSNYDVFQLDETLNKKVSSTINAKLA